MRVYTVAPISVAVQYDRLQNVETLNQKLKQLVHSQRTTADRLCRFFQDVKNHPEFHLPDYIQMVDFAGTKPGPTHYEYMFDILSLNPIDTPTLNIYLEYVFRTFIKDSRQMRQRRQYTEELYEYIQMQCHL